MGPESLYQTNRNELREEVGVGRIAADDDDADVALGVGAGEGLLAPDLGRRWARDGSGRKPSSPASLMTSPASGIPSGEPNARWTSGGDGPAEGEGTEDPARVAVGDRHGAHRHQDRRIHWTRRAGRVSSGAATKKIGGEDGRAAGSGYSG